MTQQEKNFEGSLKIRLYNTKSREVELFQPYFAPRVGIYSCGMTVYGYAHVGHIRTYTNSDVLRRLLEYAGYQVTQVMNVTDVGHMTSDEDAGEDKLELGARREGKTPWEIAEFYEDHFFSTIAECNITRPEVISRATEHIGEQIGLVKRLEDNGYTYKTDVGVIFDTSKFGRYAEFARLDLEGQEAGARVAVDDQRRNPQDFALWITNQPNHIMQWNSPWGRGFPGWHIECSAMAMRYLGDQVDIHTGGIDHIPVHHTNEIAQSECATGRQYVKYWFHSAFLNVDGRKMSKSLNNLYTLDDVRARGYSPLALRYLFLNGFYRRDMNFTWEALESAQRGLARLWGACAELPAPTGVVIPGFIEKFESAISNDLNTMNALAVVSGVLETKGPPESKASTIYKMDEVFGLDLANSRTRLSDFWRLRGLRPEHKMQAESMADKREKARKNKNFSEADRLRDRINNMGFQVEDTPQGPKIVPMFDFDFAAMRKPVCGHCGVDEKTGC